MTFEIRWDTDARKFLRKLNKEIASRIIEKVDFIRDYRAIIDVDWENKILFVLLVDHRKRIHKSLFRKI